MIHLEFLLFHSTTFLIILYILLSIFFKYQLHCVSFNVFNIVCMVLPILSLFIFYLKYKIIHFGLFFHNINLNASCILLFSYYFSTTIIDTKHIIIIIIIIMICIIIIIINIIIINIRSSFYLMKSNIIIFYKLF